jgi:hypothetical protein
VAVIATNATGDSAPALSAPSAVVVENVPENVTLPSVKPDPVRGVKVGATKGRWTNHPNGYSYQWRRCDTAGHDCVAVTAFRSTATYRPTSGDVGHTLRVDVIATDSSGDSAPATSAPSAIVTEPPA